MSIKNIIAKQYRVKVNQATSRLQEIVTPPEGWICTTRKSLAMSAAQLARRLGKSRALVSNTEKAELDGRVTLKTMQSMAEAMNCRFVYAIVPEDSVEAILSAQAKKQATQRVMEASKHMALEEQTLSHEQLEFEVERLTSEILRKPSRDFWDNEA